MPLKYGSTGASPSGGVVVFVHSHRMPGRISGARPGSSHGGPSTADTCPGDRSTAQPSPAGAHSLQALEDPRGFLTVDGPGFGFLTGGGPAAAPFGRGEMHVDAPRMGMVAKPIQSAQPLRERAHAATPP